MTDITWAALVPELTCASIINSTRFYCELLGFQKRYERPEDGFVYLCLGASQIMLEEEHAGGWTVGSLERPLGRGINFQIEVDAIQPIHQRLLSASVALFREPSEVWYRQDEIEHGQIEMLVQDPDGYLLRLTELLGTRPVSGGSDRVSRGA